MVQTFGHLSTLIHRQAAKYGDKVALKYRDYDTAQWMPITWNEFSHTVLQTANAMVASGIEVKENIATFSQNKPECLFIDFGAYANRTVNVPLYATSSAEQVAYIVNDAQIRYMFVGEQYQYDTAFSILDTCPSLRQLLIFDSKVVRDARDSSSLYFDAFLEQGKNLPHNEVVKARMSQVREDDLANILYTSGTTGEPKGVMLHHSNYIYGCRINAMRLPKITDHDISLSFLPLTHVFERCWCYLCLCHGTEICLNLRPQDIQTAMKEIRPTLMCCVPRFWEKIYAGVQEKLAEQTGLKKWLMLRAVETGHKHNIEYVNHGKTPPMLLHLRYKLYEKFLFAKLKKAIGIERGNFYPTAGAMMPDHICEFMHSVGIYLLLGYGLTESTATAACFESGNFEIGSIGPIMPEVEMKIGEQNEIMLRGRTITAGYYNSPALNAEAFTPDGWFRTGDAGYFKDGHLYLTERLKDLFKTSNGKYISPQAIETRLATDRYIEQIAVIADNRKFVSALIVPDYGLVAEYAAEKNIFFERMEELFEHPKVQELFQSRIAALQQPFAKYEHIKRFTLLPKPFCIEQGTLTNTLKLKRSMVAEEYKEQIDLMYKE